MALFQCFNVALFLLGLSVIILGSITSAHKDALYGSPDIVVPLDQVARLVAIVTNVDLMFIFVYVTSSFIVVGFLILAECIMGLYGILKRNAYLLILYCVVSLILIMLEIAIIVYIYMKANSMESRITNYMYLSMNSDYRTGLRFSGNDTFTESDDNTEQSWDNLQLSMHCCGVAGHNDWYDVVKWNTTYTTWVGDVITAERPPSCCKRPSARNLKSDITDLTSDDFIDVIGCLDDVVYSNNKGCADVLRHVISRVQVTTGGTMLVVVLIQGLCVLLACCRRVVVDKNNRTTPV